ncbi:MAG TPA: OmpH family outer membrane protein [Candidatus Cloacimonadota bacterium]|nr:OmpH family outer membrane protein [Candidatus Cloacimonadota bacterium]
MKRFVIALILVGTLSLAFAQAVKLGYVDTDRILFESNEALEIQRLFNLDKQNWTNQIRAIDQEIQRMEQDFEIDKLTKNDAAKREAQSRIEAKKAEAGRMLEEYFGEGGKAEQRYRELIDPLTTKIQNAIIKIAEDEKYTMIFDSSYPTVIYAIPSIDITDIVLTEINKDTIAPSDLGLPAEPGETTETEKTEEITEPNKTENPNKTEESPKP